MRRGCELLAELLARLARIPADEWPELLARMLAQLPED